MPSSLRSLSEALAHARLNGGLLDRSNWSKLWIVGKDALEFVHNYTTNNIKALPVGKGLATAMTTWKGTMVDHVFIQHLGGGLRVIGHPGRASAIRAALEKFLINVGVTIEDRTDREALCYLFSPRAHEIVAALTGRTGPWGMHEPVEATVAGVPVSVSRTWPAIGEGFHFLVDSEHATVVYEAIAREADSHGVWPIGAEAWEILRVELGIPAYGHEIGEDVNPWEARLADSVSMAKGCYLGQEVIARLANYDKVQRYLMGLRFEGDRIPEQGAEILKDGQKVGIVTSAAPGVALGFVKTAFAEPITRVEVEIGEDCVPAVLEARPFWCGTAGQGVGARQ